MTFPSARDVSATRDADRTLGPLDCAGQLVSISQRQFSTVTVPLTAMLPPLKASTVAGNVSYTDTADARSASK